MNPREPIIGVLALQGDVAEHLTAFTRLGASAQPIRRVRELDAVDALVIPGGESTTIGRLLDVFDLRHALQERLAAGIPAYGSCAGMILLSSEILDGRTDRQPLGAIDITVRRNAFGRQRDSYELALNVSGITGDPLRAVFIRAPWVERHGSRVQVLATVAGHAVAVRQGPVLATAFHPELGGDLRLHELFLNIVRAADQPATRPGPTPTSTAHAGLFGWDARGTVTQ